MSTQERNSPSMTRGTFSIARPAKATPAPSEAVADYPILTEVVDNPAEPEPTPRNIGLEELEKELRVELVGQLAADLERRVEARVHGRLSASIDEIANHVRDELFAEVRRTVREVVLEVLAEEKERIQTGLQAPETVPVRDR